VRLLFFPVTLLIIGSTLAYVFSDQLIFPEDYDAVVDWLRSHGDYAWAVGAAVILGDALLPLPSAPAMFAMGVIYGPLLGALISGTAMVFSGLIGYGAIVLLGRRGAEFIVGKDDLAHTERFYERWGTVAVIFGRAIGGFAEWAVIFAGLSKMPFTRVLAAICVGAYVASGVVATLGALSVFRPEIAIGISLAILGLIVLLSRWMSKQSEASIKTDAADDT
jgi:uncharacterized membrane protein YdjX (TVP38/TMEM64 family)